MNSSDIVSLMPLIIIAAAAIVIMMIAAIRRSHALTVIVALTALAFAINSLVHFSVNLPYRISPMFIIDRYAVLFMALIFIAGFALTILSYGYLKRLKINREEYYLLLLLATLGAAVLIISQHFISLFLGLEILGVSLYTLISYIVDREKGTEAGIKYLILAASASGFLLFGMALVYYDCGTMSFDKLSEMFTSGRQNVVAFTGIALMIVGIGFKLAVAPFHMWTADVYEGAPAPVTAFIATVSKGSMFALILRFFININMDQYRTLFLIFAVISILSMFAGNLLALMQTNIKRILAYSSIAHLGYLLIGFLAGREIGMTAVVFYLFAYFITIIGAFAIISLIPSEDGEAVDLQAYRGLYWSHPWLSVALTAMMLSLAGIPLTAGFIAKFYILIAGLKAVLWLPVVILVVNSALGVYYYLRIIMSMFSKQPEEAPGIGILRYAVPIGSGILIAILLIVLIWAGVFPGRLIDIIQSFVLDHTQAGALTFNIFP